MPNNPGVLECQGASIILKDKVEPYLINMEEKKEPETPEPGAQFENLEKLFLSISIEKLFLFLTSSLIALIYKIIKHFA